MLLDLAGVGGEDVSSLTSEPGSPQWKPETQCSQKLAPFSSLSVNTQQFGRVGLWGHLRLDEHSAGRMSTHLCQHAEGHVDGGQQSSKGRRHVRVEGRSSEAEDKQGSVLCQVHALKQAQLRLNFLFIHLSLRCGHQPGGKSLTWSRRIWQQSGVKCCSVARVLLRIFSRLHWTASRAFCSVSSLSPAPAASLDGVCGGRWALGRGAGGRASPFLAWKKKMLSCYSYVNNHTSLG